MNVEKAVKQGEKILERFLSVWSLVYVVLKAVQTEPAKDSIRGLCSYLPIGQSSAIRTGGVVNISQEHQQSQCKYKRLAAHEKQVKSNSSIIVK